MTESNNNNSNQNIIDNTLDQEKYKQIFENIQDVYYEVSLEGIIIEASPSITSISNGLYSRNEIIGKSINEIFANIEARELFLEELYKNFRVIDYEVDLLNKDNTLMNCAVSAKLLLDSNNNPVKIIGSLRDISKRKKIQQDLVRSEKNLRNILENSPNLTFLTDSAGEIYFVSPNVIEILGYEQSQLNKLVFPEFIHPDDKQSVFENWSKVYTNHQPIRNVEYRIIDPAGKIRWISHSANFLDSDDDFIVINSIQNITERVIAEAELTKSENLFRNLFENHVAVKLLVDPSNGDIVDANKSAAEFYGWSIDQLKKMKIYDINTSSKEDVLNQLNNAKNSRKISLEFKHRTAYGTIKDVHLYSTLIISHGRELLYSILIDITEQKIFEKETIQAKNLAERNDQLKTTFLQNISHEIRTPLNGIIGFTKLLQNFEELTYNDKTEYLDLITSSSNRLLNIITNVLDLSLIESNSLQVNKSGFKVGELIEELFETYQNRVSTKNLEFLLNIDEQSYLTVVYSDKEKIRKILSNLLDNAFKFTNFGNIQINCNLHSDYLLISIIDTGIGIDDAFKKDIFTKFWQFEAFNEDKYGGVGMGLTIAKGLADLLNLELSYYSNVKNGSSFSLVIDEKFLVKPSQFDKMVPISFEHFVDKSILIAEDDDINFLFLKNLLKKYNIRIDRAIDGEKAVELATENYYDLAFIDIRLPLMDGLEATSRIKTIKPHLPIIAQTSYTVQNDRNKCIEVGCEDYIPKPIDSNDLLKKMEIIFKKTEKYKKKTKLS